MLKRIISVIFSIILLFNMAACGNKTDDKILLSANEDNKTLIELDKDELKDKIDNKEDFILVIKLEGCASCEVFIKDVLNPFIEKTKADVYAIDAYTLDSMGKFENRPKYTLTPNIQVYKEGKSILALDYDDKNEHLKNIDAFESFISNYVVLPKIININEESLDAKINGKETFILYIGWNKCGDCKTIYSNVLKTYLINNESNVNVYYLEVDAYRVNKPATKPVLGDNPTSEEVKAYEAYMLWLNFASKYNFDSYRDGRVPTLQFYELGVLKDMIVYKNDVVENNIVKESYFNEIINTNMDDESLVSFHNQKVIEFLNKYYK